ncbi:DUF2267 domain-containing protein [Vitiosangium sp. GDMCC 1.1324]|uniref:DUF2267 domain-containing protein n=1 Tax=Vitiosangium sp. (strain GDMCC 1.1324) TaxID=2138576 RepID=UPI000D36F44B|nr:DUF2267 domain-containing protein [Vitiosangium sp. GDMCC 1.1324]PTL80616.1 DUF2267 domain-containing protein [Vitiosangium sp. GDMCC 1.1324]
MADEPEGMGEQQLDLRARRREARRTQTYALFLKDFCAASGLPRDRAEKALVSVLCALEQRLIKGEADDLRAQLPMKLQEALQACNPQRERPVWKFGLDEFLQMVAEDIGGDRAQAESVTRAAFATVRAHITEGEAEQVGHELPADLRALWARPI